MIPVTFLRMICIVLMPIVLVAGCDVLESWRDGQVDKSKQAAQAGAVALPAQPLVVPGEVYDSLPLDGSQQIVSYQPSSSMDEVELTALSAWSVEETCMWMLGRMQQDGYHTDDNPSRILEGLEFFAADKAYSSIVIKVTMNTADQCLITIVARR